MLNEFASNKKRNCSFVIRNVSPNKKAIKIFNCPIYPGTTKDLLTLPGVAEADIRASLLKGELLHKILSREIVIVLSDIDLTQFNQAQMALLAGSGADYTVSSARIASLFYDNPKNVNFSCAAVSNEVGATLTNPLFNFSYLEHPYSSKFIDPTGNEVDVSGLASYTKNASYSFSSEKSLRFQLVADYGVTVKTETLDINWVFKRYVGKLSNWNSSATNAVKAAAIKSLTPNLTKSIERTIEVSTGAGEYVYYAYPESYGDVDFAFNSLLGGFEKVESSLPITNAYGITENYCVWKSINEVLGDVKIVCSERA